MPPQQQKPKNTNSVADKTEKPKNGDCVTDKKTSGGM
jgi:hypothetical protein